MENQENQENQENTEKSIGKEQQSSIIPTSSDTINTDKLIENVTQLINSKFEKTINEILQKNTQHENKNKDDKTNEYYQQLYFGKCNE